MLKTVSLYSTEKNNNYQDKKSVFYSKKSCLSWINYQGTLIYIYISTFHKTVNLSLILLVAGIIKFTRENIAKKLYINNSFYHTTQYDTSTATW